VQENSRNARYAWDSNQKADPETEYYVHIMNNSSVVWLY